MTHDAAVARPGIPPGTAIARALMVPVLLCLGLAATPAGGQVQGAWSRSPAEAWPGDHIDVTGDGCIENGKPYEHAFVRAFLIVGQPGTPYDHYETYDIAINGEWGGLFPIPGDAPPGRYKIGAQCSASDMVMAYQQDYDFTVLGAPSSPTSSPTPSRTPSRPVEPPRSRTPTPVPTSSSPSPSPTADAPIDSPEPGPAVSASVTPSTAAVPRSEDGRPVGWLALSGALATAVALGALRLRRG